MPTVNIAQPSSVIAAAIMSKIIIPLRISVFLSCEKPDHTLRYDSGYKDGKTCQMEAAKTRKYCKTACDEGCPDERDAIERGSVTYAGNP